MIPAKSLLCLALSSAAVGVQSSDLPECTNYYHTGECELPEKNKDWGYCPRADPTACNKGWRCAHLDDRGLVGQCQPDCDPFCPDKPICTGEWNAGCSLKPAVDGDNGPWEGCTTNWIGAGGCTDGWECNKVPDVDGKQCVPSTRARRALRSGITA